ncbi:MAG: FxsA family protein, partial [Alphaproteobacteria bacterium]
IGGVLLLTPGFITDTLGLTLLFRPTRLIWGQILVRLQRMRRRGRPHGGPFGGRHGGPHGGTSGGEWEAGPRRTVVIEGDYEAKGSKADGADPAEARPTPPEARPDDERPKDRDGA